MSLDENPNTLFEDSFIVNIRRPAYCGAPPQTSLFFAKEIVVYKEYGLSIWLPDDVFSTGPQSVIDQHCGGSFESYWSLNIDAAIGLDLNKSFSEKTVLQIDDSI